MDSLLIVLLAIPLVLLSVYAGQKSYIAITNLHSYEDHAKKAAKHSNKAWRELWWTRLTQASGAATVRTSTANPSLIAIQAVLSTLNFLSQ